MPRSCSALVFAVYLVIVQLAVIGAVCQWCVANDAVVAIVAGVAGRRAFTDLRAEAGSRPRSVARSFR